MNWSYYIKKSGSRDPAFTRSLCESAFPSSEINLVADAENRVIDQTTDFLALCISRLPPDLYILFKLGSALFRLYVLFRFGRTFVSLRPNAKKKAFAQIAYSRFSVFRKFFMMVRVICLTGFYESAPVKASLDEAPGLGNRK